MALRDIAAVIISRDAEQTLAKTLDALKAFPEVVIYDNGSTDATQTIASQYANTTLHTGAFTGFGPTRNHAAKLAQRNWIFAIDSDEWPSKTLLASLAEADLSDPSTVFSVLRENRLMGRAVTRGGWGNEWKPRLYCRQHTAFEDVAVHERLRVLPDSSVKRLNGLLIHDNIRDIAQFLDKTNRYSDLRARDVGHIVSPALIVLRACWAFVRSYVLQLGMLSGWRGLLIAWSNANGVFYKYMKAYAAAKTGSNKNHPRNNS